MSWGKRKGKFGASFSLLRVGCQAELDWLCLGGETGTQSVSPCPPKPKSSTPVGPRALNPAGCRGLRLGTQGVKRPRLPHT